MSARKLATAVRNDPTLLQKPDRSKDVIIGRAVIPYGWDNYGNQGWRLPGRRVTTDYMDAVRAAQIIDRLMARAGARGDVL